MGPNDTMVYNKPPDTLSFGDPMDSPPRPAVTIYAPGSSSFPLKGPPSPLPLCPEVLSSCGLASFTLLCKPATAPGETTG